MAQTLFCEKDRQTATQPLGGGTGLPLSLTSPKKNTKKAQEPPNPNLGAYLSRSCTKYK